MPVQPTYPGVYIEEIPSGVRTITGVATSITAFIGRAQRGPVNKAETINSYGDFERKFGGLWVESRLAYAVRDFYLNGGSQAVIVRVASPNFATDGDEDAAKASAQAVITAAAGETDGAAAKAAAKAESDAINGDAAKTEAEKKGATKALAQLESDLADDGDANAIAAACGEALGKIMALKATSALGTANALNLEAISPGMWGNQLQARIDYSVFQQDDLPSSYVAAGLSAADLFNLSVHDRQSGASESFRNLSLTDGPRPVKKVLETESNLVRLAGDPPAARPEATDADAAARADDASAAAKADFDAAKAAADAAPSNLALQNAASAQKRKWEAVMKDADRQKKAASGNLPASLSEEFRWVKFDQTGTDGGDLTSADFVGEGMEAGKRGLFALEDVDLFNLLYFPPYADIGSDGGGDIEYEQLVGEAEAYCIRRRAMLILDSPSGWTDKDRARDGMRIAAKTGKTRNSAIFFPRVRQSDPERDGRIATFGSGGAVAGIFARTDVERGVWKAPAGLDATLRGVPELSVILTDPENGELNPLGLNCLRVFPIYGRIVWGSRTSRGADVLGDEYKYVPVRRTALFIEESLYRGTKWVVFEPNDERTWAAIRLNVGAFMHDLFKKGAFQSITGNARDSYFVKCDAETTTQNDINLGIVNIVVGFAPLKPAEFVIIKIQQIVGDIET